MKTRMQQDANKNANKNANNRTKHETETNYKEKKKLDRIELVARAIALIPDDMILTRSGSLDTCHKVWMTPLPQMEDKSG